MKLLTIVLLLCSIAAFAQTPTHSATLTWSDTANPAGTTYNVYRAIGMCSGTPTFAKLASGITQLTYVDNSVQPGDYCFAVSATFNGMESALSNTALAAVPSFPPATLTVSVK